VPSDVNIGFTGFGEPFLNKRAIKMIEIAAERNPVYISTTLAGLDIEDIPKLEAIDFTYFAVHLPSESGDNIPVQPELVRAVMESGIINQSYHYHGERVHPDLSFAPAKRTQTHSRAGNVDYIKDGERTGPVRCRRGFAHPVLLPNGDLAICCMDYGLKHIIGNLLEQDIDEIYTGKAFWDFIKTTKQNRGSLCHKCKAYGASA
jgi:radical SAM protein with 4Fe4S-binding SPASM domain